MLKKTYTYNDLNGVERTESVYFNLNKSELMKMEIGTNGGYAEMVQRIVDAKDGPAIMKTFEELILKAYGVKSDDGRRFIKSAELSEAFAQTEVYDMLFMELVTDADAAASFIKGIMPSDLEKQLEAAK